jgi:molecular chaperone DnaK
LKGGDGRSCVFEYELRGEQIEPLVEPYVRQSVGICRRVLAEANLRPGDIEKVLLVGGPTLMSYVRRRLEDPEGGLNITLEHGINPMTVVAQGAAIFAANEPCPLDEDEDSKRKPRHGYKLNLRYEQISSEEKPEVNGQVVPPDGAPGLSGYEIQFANDEGGAPWSSNKITLRPEGRFTAELSAPTKGQTYIYQIKLMTAQGDKVEVEPDTCSYTRTEGFEPGTVTPTLTNSIGVALASNEVMWFFKKGTRLPCEKSSLDNLRWVHHFRSEQAGASLNIPIVEGENQKADRNQIVCELMVPTGSLKRDIRAGEDVEIAIKIDKSQVLTIELYTAALRKEKIETVLKKGSALPTAEQLDRHTRQIKARLEKVKDSVLETGDPKSLLILNTLDKDSTLQEIDKQQNAAATDAGARGKLEQMLRELKARIDEVEDANEIPAAELEADKVSAWAQEVVKHYGNEVDRQNFQIRQRELLAARRAHNTSPQELRRKTELMNSFAFEIYGKTSENWIGMFQDLENRDINDFTDPKLAVELLTQGRTAVSANEFERLRTAVRQLWQLLERSPEINRPPIDWSNY